jgi:hypothetical protein
VASGGPGDDELDIGSDGGEGNRVACGPGRDRLVDLNQGGVFFGVLVATDCEAVEVEQDFDVSAVPKVSGTRAAFTVSCPKGDDVRRSDPCTGRIAISRFQVRTALGATRFTIPNGRSGRVVVDLGPAGGKLLARPSGFKGSVRVNQYAWDTTISR